MEKLHILIGDGKGDPSEIKKRSAEWKVPMSAGLGDDVVFYFPSREYRSFLATGKIGSTPLKSGKSHGTVYRAMVNNITQLTPVPLEIVQKELTDWPWPKYTRSYTTITGKLAKDFKRILNRTKRSTDSSFSVIGEAKKILRHYAKQAKTVTYGEFSRLIGMHHRSPLFRRLLERISLDEEKKGRGLLSALVVNASTMKAGDGFLIPAKAAGRDISDLDKCWREECDRLFAIWGGGSSISETEEETKARTEGNTKLYSHLVRERNSVLRYAKLRKSSKPYRCEACEMSFVERYGKIGDSFIEVHHRIAIADGERRTTIDDLALLCSNCHRMIHKTDDLSDIQAFKKMHLNKAY